jgi:hypothetical protein
MADPVLPEGLATLFITGSTQGTHKIKTGEDLTEALPYCFVSKQALVDEIQFKGQISDFYSLKDKLKKYSSDKVRVRPACPPARAAWSGCLLPSRREAPAVLLRLGLPALAAC